MTTITLNVRARYLLKLMVERYIREGKPVGSRILAREMESELSPATLRNTIADLEDMGLLTAPHTSAGRVPTVLGYRYFVDHLMVPQPPMDSELKDWQTQLIPDQSIGELVAATSTWLSDVTHLAGLVMVPRPDALILRHVAFLPLSAQRVLAILVVNDREVRQRVIYTERMYSHNELDQAAHYLNDTYAGQTLELIRAKIMQEMHADQQSMDSALVAIGQSTFAAPAVADDYVLIGRENLLSFLDIERREELQRLFAAFNQKRDILHLLEQFLTAGDGPRAVIGSESGCQLLEQCSIVAAPYTAAGQILGMVAVIGPTRMPYEKIFPLVQLAATFLGSALNQHTDNL